MNDVSPILLESVQKYFDMWFYSDKEVKKIYKKVRNGNATFKEMKRFSECAGSILCRALEATFTAENLPDGKLYQNIAEKVITPMLEQNHELISEVCGYVGDDLNRAARIGTNTVTAVFNADKAETVAQIAANCGEIKPGNKAAQLVENATMSMVDDFIQANLEFQKKLGLVPQIQRIYHGRKNRCEFCASLQYTGEYKGPGMPSNIFQRHRDCRCTLIYKPQKGPYQDPWSKAEKDDYHNLVAEQRKHLTELDKMSPGERRLARNARAREKRRSQYSPAEWSERKAQQKIIAENRAAGKEYRPLLTEYEGIPQKWKNERINKENLLDTLEKVNPKYKDAIEEYLRGTKYDYTHNCTNCVVAYEMRKRGYNVTACSAGENRRLRNKPFSAWKDGIIESTSGKGVDDIRGFFLGKKDGTTVEIAVEFPATMWYNKPKGHVFVAEKIDGKVVFIDPQIGKILDESIFEDVIDNKTQFMRIDNLDVSDRGVSACKLVKK